MAQAIGEAEREVWDILDAGPRNCFTAEGLLVHNCVILDHADNTLRMGFVTDINPTKMYTSKKGEKQQQTEQKQALPKECPACSFLKPPKVRQCPVCQFVPEKQSEIEEEQGDLIEITAAKAKANKAEKQRWHSQLRFIAQERGYSTGWVAQTYRKRFGLGPRGIDETRITRPEADVRSYVQHQLIRYAKGRKAA